jgi:hypothetical protein
MQTIEPSAEFRQRMQARLAETRIETQRDRFARAERDANASGATRRLKQPMVMSAVAASVLMMGTVMWRQSSSAESVADVKPASIATVEKVEAPTVAADTTRQPIYLSPELVQAMATGNPMWPAALLVDDAPAQLMNAEFTMVRSLRD